MPGCWSVFICVHHFVLARLARSSIRDVMYNVSKINSVVVLFYMLSGIWPGL